MSLFRSVLPQEDNLISISQKFLELIKGNVTRNTVKEHLLSHPEYPSLLSLSESLNIWKIENAALQLEKDQLIEIETPFVTSFIQNGNAEFVIIKSYKNEMVSVIRSNGEEELSYSDFVVLCNGAILLAETSEHSGEPDYKKNSAQQRNALMRIPFLLIVIGLFLLTQFPQSYLPFLTELSICAIGIFICGILFLISNSKGDTISICKANEKIDCKEAMDSPIAKVLGVDLIDLGLTFFASNFILLLLSIGPNQMFYLNILLYSSTLALPVTLFLFYYQWRILKKWCSLCLAIQGLVWINTILLSLYVDLNVFFDYVILSKAIFVYLIVFLIWNSINSLIIRGINSDYWKYRYLRIKNNKEMFSLYLQNQQEILSYENKLTPLILGDKDAKHTITIITNPYCKPCAKIHEGIQDVLHRVANTKFHIIFFNNTAPARHLLLMQRMGLDFEKALEEWFSQPVLDYENWASEFPVSAAGDFDSDINNHREWCREAGIPHTPYLCINGFACPEGYEVEEVVSILERTSFESEVQLQPE